MIFKIILYAMFKCLFVVKNLILFTYTPQSHSHQIYTHLEAAGFR